MIKVFSIIRGTRVEHEVNLLIEKGVSYISKFEEVFGIVGCCNNIEIFFSNQEEKTDLFLIINGDTKFVMLENYFVEKGAVIITIELLKHIMTSNSLVLPKTFHRVGYKVELFLAEYRVWKINSIGEKIA